MNAQSSDLRCSEPVIQRRHRSNAEYRGWYLEVVGPADVLRGSGFLWIISFCGIVAVGDAPSFHSATAAALAGINRIADQSPWN
jgi:hypothetical protein